MSKQFDVDLDNATVNIDVFTKTDAALAELETKYGTESLPSVETKEGYAFIKDAIKTVSGYRTTLEKKRKEIKQPYLDAGRIIDSEAKRITKRLLAVETPMKEIKKEFDEREKRKKEERLAKQRNALSELCSETAKCIGSDSQTIQNSIEKIHDYNMDQFFELKKEALEARNQVLAQLGQMLSDAIQRESMAKMLAEQEQKISEMEAKHHVEEQSEKANEHDEESLVNDSELEIDEYFNVEEHATINALMNFCALTNDQALCVLEYIQAGDIPNVKFEMQALSNEEHFKPGAYRRCEKQKSLESN